MNDHMIINKILNELERIKREGLPYNGPEIEWMCGTLAATCPEPHIALSTEYLDLNEDLIVDEEYVNKIKAWVQHEGGYRSAVETLTDVLGMYAHRRLPAPLPAIEDEDDRLSPLANTILEWMRA